MFLQGFWQAIEGLPLSQYVAASSWAFPTLESIHVVAIVSVIGSILVVDLRLIGVASKALPITQMTRETLRWTWGAFAVAMVSGLLLFISKATNYAVNPYFIWKMVLIALAGVNMAVFHLYIWRTIADWDTAVVAPLPARIAGGLSLFLWVIIVFVARAIGFTLDIYSR